MTFVVAPGVRLSRRRHDSTGDAVSFENDTVDIMSLFLLGAAKNLRVFVCYHRLLARGSTSPACEGCEDRVGVGCT